MNGSRRRGSRPRFGLVGVYQREYCMVGRPRQAVARGGRHAKGRNLVGRGYPNRRLADLDGREGAFETQPGGFQPAGENER